MATNVYVNGLNLYYCAVNGTPYKWLDIFKLCNNLFPGKTFKRFWYFSAKVIALQHDPGAPTRQEIYWRALKTIPDLEIIKGNFVSWPRLMPQFPLAYINGNLSKPPQKVQVERTDEKGSDVNLASYLIYDGVHPYDWTERVRSACSPHKALAGGSGRVSFHSID